MDYHTVMAIMNRGKTVSATDAINQLGNYSGVLLTGRGAGLHENQKILNIAVEPEKEILLLVTPTSQLNKVIYTLNNANELTKPGHGILISIPIKRVHESSNSSKRG